MKKIFILSIFVCIIIFISPFAMASSKAIVNIEAVRMRKEKSTDSDILTIVYENDECELLEESGEWCKIKYGEYTGYAKSEFFTIKNDTTTTVKNTANNTANNTVNNTVNNVSTNKIENKISNTTNNEITNNVNSVSTYSVPNVDNISIEIVVSETYTISNNTYVKNLPNFASVNKDEIISGTSVKVESNMNNWYKVFYDGKFGWINKNDLKVAISEKIIETEKSSESTTNEQNVENKSEEKDKTENKKTESESTSISTTTTKTGIINVDTARIREKASTSAEIIGTLDKNEEITILAEEGDFYKFKLSNIEGYVSKTLVDIKDVTSRSSTESRETTGGTGADVVEFAKKYLGYSYVSGGKNPETGFDCSGFTKYVFSNFGVELGATTADQLTRGTEVARENMQIGDIILYYNDAKTKVGHVGIYMGNGEFIHSANPKRGVVTDNLNTNTYYNTRYICARRLL